jgi:hypothetical protein
MSDSCYTSQVSSVGRSIDPPLFLDSPTEPKPEGGRK